MGKIYEIYSTADVKAKFMGAAYFYTKFDIMLSSGMGWNLI